MKISLQDFDFYSDKCHVMGSADQMEEPPNSFLWWLHHFIFSPTVPNGPVSPTPVVSRNWQECVKSASVMSDSLRLYGLCPARLLCPWGFPGKNTGVGCHAFLQGIFLTQGLNQHILYLLHWQVGSLPPVLPGSPWGSRKWKISVPSVESSSHVRWKDSRFFQDSRSLVHDTVFRVNSTVLYT